LKVCGREKKLSKEIYHDYVSSLQAKPIKIIQCFLKIDVLLFLVIEAIEGIDISMCSMASNMFANRITIYNSPCVIIFLLVCSFYNIEM
jgi:hypothetical protein